MASIIHCNHPFTSNICWVVLYSRQAVHDHGKVGRHYMCSATRHSQCSLWGNQAFHYRHTSLPVPHSHIHTTVTPNAAWDKFQRFQLYHGHLPTTSLPQSPPRNNNLINTRPVTSPQLITNTGTTFKKWYASNTDGWSLLCSTRSRTGNGRSSPPYAAQ